MLIREERIDDIERIDTLTQTAFLNAPRSSHTEHLIVDRLRRENSLYLSLVAESEGTIVGHIAFSEVEISDGTTHWFGLGPVSVHPDRHHQGIGSALVRAGLERLRQQGAHGCVLQGDPGFYRRFGFANDPELVLEGVPQAYFLALPFSTTRASGMVTYHPAFFSTC